MVWIYWPLRGGDVFLALSILTANATDADVWLGTPIGLPFPIVR